MIESLQLTGILFMYTIKPSALNFLVPLYNSPQRHYHNLDHIHFCLHKLDEYITNNEKISLKDIKALVYSIWFHDAFYSPYPHLSYSNEKNSADLFHDWFVSEAKFDDYADDFYKNVRYNILLTEFHLHDLSDKFQNSTSKIMLDIDLVGFARSFDIVMATSEQIFMEYECLGLSKKVMLENRIAFLEKLLSKQKIFYTDYFYENYESIARDNIEEVIIRSTFELSNL